MPYNNTPIAPAKEITGHVSLPLARVQKIIVADPNHLTVSKNASFAIALATEMFIQHLATTTHNVVKAERKPRRNIQYRDVSSAVAKTDNLEFLVDVVPKTLTLGAYRKELETKKKAAEEGEKAVAAVLGNGAGAGGQKTWQNANGSASKSTEVTLEDRIDSAAATLNAKRQDERVQRAASDETIDAMDLDTEKGPETERAEDSGPEEDSAAMQIEMEMRGPPRSDQTASPEVRRSSGFTAINGAK